MLSTDLSPRGRATCALVPMCLLVGSVTTDAFAINSIQRGRAGGIREPRQLPSAQPKTALVRGSSPLGMGLYDEPLPPPPPREDPNAKKHDMAKKKKFGGREDDEGQPDEEDLDRRPILFSFDDGGNEVKGLLPPLKRSLASGIPCYYEPSDSLVRQIVRRTECHPSDAAWALEAHGGKIVDASVSISLAQRKALNESVELPGEEEVKSVDWDGEMRDLMRKTETSGDLGLEFENEGRSLGLDGLEERKEFLERRARKEDMDRLFSAGEKDANWVPGNPDARPADKDDWDDEPWFTG